MDVTARLKFSDKGELAGLRYLNSTLHECLSLAANHFIAVVVYTMETPFPDSSNREAAGEVLGGMALTLAAESKPDKYKHIAKRIEKKDSVFIGTCSKYVRVLPLFYRTRH